MGGYPPREGYSGRRGVGAGVKTSDHTIAYWVRHEQPPIYYACPRNGERDALGYAPNPKHHTWYAGAKAFSCCWEARLADWCRPQSA